MSTLVASNKAASVRTAELISTELKKFSIELPAGIHQNLKMIAAAQGTTIRALLLEAAVEYIIPKYTIKE